MEHNFPCSFSSCRLEKSLSRPFEPIKSNALLHPDVGSAEKNEVAAVTPIHRRELEYSFLHRGKRKRSLAGCQQSASTASSGWLHLIATASGANGYIGTEKKKRVASRRDAQIERSPLATDAILLQFTTVVGTHPSSSPSLMAVTNGVSPPRCLSFSEDYN